MPRPAQWSSICENVSRFSLGRLKQSVPSRTPALGQGVVTMGGRATFAGGRGGIVLRGGGGSNFTVVFAPTAGAPQQAALRFGSDAVLPQTNLLFAVQKCDSDTNSQDTTNVDPITQKWWDMMADIMEVNPDNSPVTIPLEELFHMD